MRYNQLNEAIIKVPQELLNKVNVYVSSYLYFKINQYIERLNIFVSANTSDEEKQKIIQDGKNTMQKLHTKYGAKNISADTANNISGKAINIPIDIEKFFSELNFKGIDPGLISLLKDRVKIELFITSNSHGIAGSKERHGTFSHLVTVVVGSLGPRPSFLETANNIMSTTYHELQHVVQSLAIENINKYEKQLQRNAGYSNVHNDPTDYYTSGLEYSPQLGNLIDYVSIELEKSTLDGNLNPDKNLAIKDAMNNAVQKNADVRTFLISLYKKQPEQYKKAMKNVYTRVAPVYDDFKENGLDYTFTELPSEELEANVDVMKSVYKLMSKNDKYKVQAYGSDLNSITQLKVSKDHWSITLTKNEIRKDNYYINIDSTDPEFEEMEKMDAKQVLSLFGILSEITWYDAVDIVDDFEYITGQRIDVNNESMYNILESLKSDAQHMDVPFEILSNNSFKLFGKTFEVNPVQDSQGKVDITYDGDKTLFVWSLKQLLVAFQMMIRYYVSYPDEVLHILDNSVMYVEFMSKLRKL
ncbi:putative structural protein [Erwinia phage pEa_SNUABM_47]|uniref:Putative structural protein n=1 Tax=Erwinia phage pEa_SNUABM_47 TaxID=2768774 RepID=A0A7L8ZNS2_9CAUD|nr:putative structural protein [Erwinia phage pEa_SNUABM_47]